MREAFDFDDETEPERGTILYIARTYGLTEAQARRRFGLPGHRPAPVRPDRLRQFIHLDIGACFRACGAYWCKEVADQARRLGDDHEPADLPSPLAPFRPDDEVEYLPPGLLPAYVRRRI